MHRSRIAAVFWKRDFSTPEAYSKSLEPNRKRLAHILGVRDARVPFDGPELVGTTAKPALVGKGEVMRFSPCVGRRSAMFMAKGFS